MRLGMARGVSKLPPVGRILLLAVAVSLCFFLGTGSSEAQPADDHGNSFSMATTLPLGSSITGRIDPGDDWDAFKLDLSSASGNTSVWIYTTGNLDTLGGLYDSRGTVFYANDNTTTTRGVVVETNFRIPWTLAPGVYYVGVFSTVRGATGNYTLHAVADDHGQYLGTATTLTLGSSAAGRIDPGFDGDFFKLNLSGASGNTHVWIYTTGTFDTWGGLYDSNGDRLRYNDDVTRGGKVVDTNFHIPWTLAPGVYYVGVFSADDTTTGDYTLHAKADDHGHYSGTRTILPLGSSVAGRIAPELDWDTFKLDLSGASGSTDIWIYTTGGLDTRGWLYDSDINLLAFNAASFIEDRESNFHIRRNLPKGVYYVEVQSYSSATTGDYILYAVAATDPGSVIGTATPLNLDSPTPGAIGSASDADYFRLVLAESRNLVVQAVGLAQFDGNLRLLPLGPLDVAVLNGEGETIGVNVYPIQYTGGKLSSAASRHGFRIEDHFDTGAYYIKVTAPASDTTYPMPYTIHAYEDTDYANFIDDCEAATAALNDPQINDSLYGCQWHLRNQEQGGEDINVEPVWAEGINGEGVNIAVVDDGLYFTHEDLATNVNPTLNHNYQTSGRDIYEPFEHHGTNVAGIIAARDNGTGVRGVAPRATIYGYNYLAGDRQQFQDINRADAMARNRVITAVSNNSWGSVDGPGLSQANRLWKLAVDSGVREGYDGKGVFYVFAGGNGGSGHRENPDGTPIGGHFDNVKGRGDDSNLDGLANYYAVTAVCAVNDEGARSVYSEKGANLWVCAPSKDGWEQEYRGHRGIVTTENSDRYRKDFGGTSAAAPIVSGVAALLRDANPDLTWRDLKLVLAASARKNDAANSGWAEGARKYGAGLAADRYHFNHEYGFGVVDAKAAVDLARGWTNVPPLESASAVSSSAITIPPPLGSTPRTVTTTLTLNTGIGFTEFVEINADFRHTSFRDMEVELVSPSGAVSKLAVPFNTRHYHTDDACNYPGFDPMPCIFFVWLDGEFRFGSARHLGEDPNGVWTLRLTDYLLELGGTLRSWNIKVYGHKLTPAPPTLDSLTAGEDSLTVAWSAPAVTRGSSPTSYDLRYIVTEADKTVDANWTIVRSIWRTGGGNLSYELTGLAGGSQYDVQVRAVSSAGDGAWSRTLTNVVTLDDVVDRYDEDGDGAISKREAIAAVIDYFNGIITKEDAITVIIAYFSS